MLRTTTSTASATADRPRTTEPVAHVKRLLELVQANPAYRRAFEDDPVPTAAQSELALDEEEVTRFAHYLRRPAAERQSEQLGPAARAYLGHLADEAEKRAAVREQAAPTQPLFRAWRARQIRRTYSEQGSQVGNCLLYLPAAIELSKGCSVGCWFCGVSAPKLSQLFPATPENDTTFRACLDALVSLCGAPSASTSLTYWATDPLDNPDFERYAERFHALTGAFPNFTTALALRDVDRTRRLLATSREAGGICRFSVLSIAMLRRLHRTFDAEEMAHVECVLVNKESNLIKANAGRFREKAQQKPELLEQERDKAQDAGSHDPYATGSIACVAGFLFNLVERSVRLISPCRADDEWPLGYREHAFAHFEHDGDIGDVLAAMITRHMPADVPEETPLAFRPDLAYDEIQNGFSLTTPFRRVRLESPAQADTIKAMGTLLRERSHDATAIRHQLRRAHDAAPAQVDDLLRRLFHHGSLDDNPSWLTRPTHGLRVLASER